MNLLYKSTRNSEKTVTASQAILKGLAEDGATLNRLSHVKERLIEITVDGELTEDELPDFLRIKDELSKMALAIDSLNLWLDHTIASGKIDKQVLEEIIHRK